MLQRFCRPAPGLRQFVRFYTQRQVTISGAPVIHPVTARAVPMIEFELGDPIKALYHEQHCLKKSPAVTLVGPQTHRRVDLQLLGTLEHFVVMFQPCGLTRLFAISMSELVDEDCDGHALLGCFVSQAYQRLGECRSFEERVRFVDELLLRRSLTAPGYDGISAAASRILSGGGRVAITTLADYAGFSMRQFERRFIQQVGMRPKLFARIARFEAALDGKARFAARSWTDVAHQFGYYDQMHMIRDFGQFTGETPSKTLAQLETVFSDRLLKVRARVRSQGPDENPRMFF